MMKQKSNILRGRLRRTLLSGDQSGSYPAGSSRAWFCSRLVVALTLLAWLLPQRAAATYVDEKSNYSVMLGGSNVIYFYAPVYDMDGADCWVYDGNLEVSVDDGAKTTIFTWGVSKDVDNDDTE